MTRIEQKLRTFETRPATVDVAEQNRRIDMLQHFSAINKFEGLLPSAIDERLFQLLAAGKISKHEYLDLCLSDARSAT